MVELFVDRIVAGGSGLAELDGLKVFVPFAAPQERVRCRLTVRKKDYAVARIEEILEPSPVRVEPRCPFFGECGGCQLQHLSYEGQLVVKKLIVNDALQRLGRIFVPVGNISSPSAPWHYRNKTQYPVGYVRGLRIGFFRRESHDLLDIPACLLHPEEFDRLRETALEAMVAAGETAYDERNHKGNIRHFIFRTSGTETQVIVVTRTDSLKPLLIERLAGRPGVSNVVQSVNRGRTNRILGDKVLAHVGKPELVYRILDKRFRVSAQSFFQVNTSQAEELCRKVLRYVAPEGGETVLDLYSGVGMISLIVAGFVARVIGVELDEAAVEDARFNAELNACTNARFIAADAENALAGIDRADVVLLDPPRRGCAPEVLRRVAGHRPRRVIYVSCNPATLARDLRLFEELGYHTREVEPLDMFPQTFHVETVARLEPKE